MTENQQIPPLPADVLIRKVSAFRGLVDIAKDVAAKGLIEYGEPLSLQSQVVIKTLHPGKDGAPPTVEERREPLTTLNALDSAIREGIDSACYAIAAQQAYGCQNKEKNDEMARGIWQIIHGLQTLHTIATSLADD